MGTLFRLVIYTEEENEATEAAQLAFRRVDALNSTFSDYESTSEAMRLSTPGQVGQQVTISPDMNRVLAHALRLSRKTRGAFDVTIGPLSKLWRRAFRRNEFPETTKIAQALGRVGFRQLKLRPARRSLRIRRTGLRLDFGGIAKGYTIDEMARLLRDSSGIHHFLVDGGGDIYAGEAPPGEQGWKISLPSGKSLILSNEAIAVSGDRYRFLEWNGQRYSHIIDPRTGLGTTHRTTVGVRARTCMEADAWASAFVVLGELQGRRLARRHKNNIQVYFFQNEMPL